MWPSSYTPKDITKRNENMYQHKNLYINVLAALFIIAPNGDNPNVHQLIKRINKMWYIHKIDYYVAIKRNEVHITTWMSLENIMLSERSQTHKYQFSSVTQSCPTLCDPMNRNMPGLPVHHQLPESTQTHVHWVRDAIQPSHPLTSPSPPALNLSQHQGLFKWVSSLHQVAKILEFQLQNQSYQLIPRTDLL